MSNIEQSKHLMSGTEEQRVRAMRCAMALGSRTPVPHSLYRALLALVESVEKPGAPEPCKPRPVSDARKVLAPERRVPKAKQNPVKPIQEGLW